MNYSPDDYDSKGQLRLPLSFWAILLLQARTWLLFVMAGVSRQQGSELLALFYPDNQAFWLGLALGVPAVLGLLLTGYRQRAPRLWQAWRWVLIVTFALTLIVQTVMALQDQEQLPDLALLVVLLDVVALLVLLFYRRLVDCFAADDHH